MQTSQQELSEAYACFIALGRKTAIGTVVKLQAELWVVEQALNTPLEQRLTLGKDWTKGTEEAIAECGARVSTKLTEQKMRLEEMESTYGKADDLREQIVALLNEYNDLIKTAPGGGREWFPPKGFRSMNSLQLKAVLINSKNALGALREYIAAAVQREADRIAQLERAEILRKESAEFIAKMSAIRNAREEQVLSVTASYVEAIEKLKAHTTFGQAVLPKVDLTISRPLWLEEAEFQSALEQLRAKIVAAKRGLREPMRRAWQSAYSRKFVKLDFKPYLEQEGFADLLK